MTDDSRFTHDVAVIGLGYIGLPTAAALATHGASVVGVDINEQAVAAVNRGELPICEPDLAVVVNGAISMGLLTASTSVPQAQTYIVAVPTPFEHDHRPDLSYIRAATEAIAPHLQTGALVILESTSPPGTTGSLSRWLADLRPDLRFPHQIDAHASGADAGEPAAAIAAPDVHIAYCPERVLPGRIMIEIVANDRVIGGLTPACATRAAEVYRKFVQGAIRLTTAPAAELTKLAENAYRDVNIAFANELSLVSEQLGTDVWEVIELANLHPRVDILRPGPGVGGHCIAVDPWFIVAGAPEQTRLIRTAREVNDGKPGHVVERIVQAIERTGASTLACFGLAFKADIDDLRESPALAITQHVAQKLTDVEVLAVEPHVQQLPEALSGCANVRLTGASEALERADVVVLLVDHSDFRSVTAEQLAGRTVLDTRGLWRALAS